MRNAVIWGWDWEKRNVGEAGEGVGSPAGGRSGGVYTALVALATIASKADGNLDEIIPKE